MALKKKDFEKIAVKGENSYQKTLSYHIEIFDFFHWQNAFSFQMSNIFSFRED